MSNSALNSTDRTHNAPVGSTYSYAPWDMALVPQPAFTDALNPVPLKPEERMTIIFHPNGIPMEFLISREYPADGQNIDLRPFEAPYNNQEVSFTDSYKTRRRIMTLKIVWPGYATRPFTRDISLISENGTLYTHAELAKCIALAYKEFFSENEGVSPDPAHAQWSFNSLPNALAHFYLVSVTNTNGEYFQADVRLVRQGYVN